MSVSCDCHVTICMFYIHICVVVCPDLMLPGVVGVSQGGAGYASLQKGQVCAVNLLKNM